MIDCIARVPTDDVAVVVTVCNHIDGIARVPVALAVRPSFVAAAL